MYQYNKNELDEFKQSLSIEQIFDLVADLGGEPIMEYNSFKARTICHNVAGSGSHKLYYYNNTKLFKCYTDCDSYMDIFELVRKQKSISSGIEWSLPKAVAFVAMYFGYLIKNSEIEQEKNILKDWSIINNYERMYSREESKQIVELKKFDINILQYLPRPRVSIWEQEGIKKEIIINRGIAYDPKNEGIVIPHFDIDGNLVGIRERTLIKEVEKYAKYMPAKLNNKMYNHPLSFNLYNLNNSKNAIKILQKAIVFEGEKATMMYASYFGEDNDISVACCGSSLIGYQVQLLLSLGVKEIIIAFDKQFKEIGDDEYKRWIKKLKSISTKYRAYCNISFLFDKENLLNYKDSPIDKGEEIFLKLFKNRLDADGR